MKNQVLTVKETAVLLGTTPRAVYARIYRQQLPHRRLGGRVVILVEDLNLYLNSLPGLSAQEALDSVEQAS